MFNSSSSFPLIGALVGASAYAQAVPPFAEPMVPIQAVENIQRARVDIYCGHRMQAVADIRAARQQLRASGAKLSPKTLAALDEAAWLTRRRQHALAEQSLDSVLQQLAADRSASIPSTTLFEAPAFHPA